MTNEKPEQIKKQNVYEAIAAVQASLAKDGIGKDRKNKEQGYQFRGIDDVYNSLSHFLSEHRLCILPRALSREMKERLSKNGSPLFTVVIEAEFDFVSADDGSKHTIKTYGEAMDSADKATNKAMSAAYKYACLQTFCIPTEGDNDADASTPQVVAVVGAAVFVSPELRSVFVGNCIEAINNAISLEAVKDQRDLSRAKWDAMKNSSDESDRAGWEKICAAYNAAIIKWQGAVKTVAVPPKTVEAAMPKTAGSVLGEDVIPF